MCYLVCVPTPASEYICFHAMVDSITRNMLIRIAKAFVTQSIQQLHDKYIRFIIHVRLSGVAKIFYAPGRPQLGRPQLGWPLIVMKSLVYFS